MLEQIKEQIEKSHGVGVDFYNKYIERQTTFTGKMIDAGINNAKKMSECKSVADAIENQVSHYKNMQTDYEVYNAENTKAFDKMQADLGKISKTV
jgi:hypothetical protein